MRNSLLICLLILILSPGQICSQDNRIVFSHVDVNDGLSDNWIKCIFKDSRGFVWFGTNNGLNRFDGYRFEIFKNSISDSTTIADNVINVITEDKKGNLWIGTRSGISVLNTDTYKFERVNLVSSLPLLCQDIAYITAMASDGGGNILIGTHHGLFFKSQASNFFRHILVDEHECSSQINNITSITNDGSGSFWIGTSNGYLVRYNYGSNMLEKFESFREKNERRESIAGLFVDNQNNLWVADINGLNLFNIDSVFWHPDFHSECGVRFRYMQITGIDQDIDGQIWIATDGGGLFKIDREDFSIYNITNMPYAEGTLSSNGLTALVYDQTGILWVGNAKKGVDFYKKNVRKFRLFRNYPTDPNSLTNNDVNCITEDVRGNIWIGTNGGGLNCYNRKTGEFTHYRSEPGRENSLSSNIIVSLFEDSENKIWAGTYLGGLNCIDPVTGKIRIFRNNNADSTTISDDRIWGICEDSRKNLWVATLTSGINLFDRATGTFRRFDSQNSAICFNYINSIAIDENDHLWLSSANGLIFYDPFRNRSKCYYSDPASGTSLSDNHVISTFKDSRGLFWVCTNNGLNVMDQERDQFRVFTEADGLPSNRVLRILEDTNAGLWISTKNGISKLIVGNNGEEGSFTFTFMNYGISDGLQGKEFNETAAFESGDGELWFGGPDGLNAFYPSEIREEMSFSELALINLRIDNRIVRTGDVLNNRILLGKPLFNMGNVVLKYKENSFIIDFVVLNYFFPERNRYAYNLEGFNEKWIITEGRENFASFSNLTNGNYTFRLKATNSDGIWNENEISLRIRILPPFWKSWYAYIIYAGLIFTILSGLRYLILSRERLRMQMEKESIESHHLHEIDALKIKFFTNISHEFRTPLSLIISPVDKLMGQWKDKPEEKYLNMIRQNARRLLLMVNQLLDFRKMEVQGFGFNPSCGDIVNFIGEIAGSFTDLGEQKKIKLLFESEIEELNMWFDKDKLEKIIFNLLSNAFKFTPEGGMVTVTVSGGDHRSGISNENENRRPQQVRIIVKDTGIGIPSDRVNRLFTSFYQIEPEAVDNSGTGLGLSLVKEFVKLHEGKILVRSEPGEGSCFTIILPVTEIREADEEIRTGEDAVMHEEVMPGPVTSTVQKKDTSREMTREERPVILIAEDNDDLRFYIKDNLKVKYDLYEASGGEEALAIILKIVPDLIISDVVMPGMDGIELCRRVKAGNDTSHIPVILLTARSTETEQSEFLEAGADDCITKPFSFQILEAKINNFISIRRSLRKKFMNNFMIEPKDIEIISLDEQFIHKTLDLVDRNMSKSDYTVEELSRDLGISRTLLYKRILALTGKPPLEFIRSLRLKRAAQLLEKSQLNISEVAFKVGFNDPKYFRKHFKDEFGEIPSRYSERFRQKKARKIN
ncbi:MAG: response regulator [Bacteroidales bacterium]|nr:response regulator [Bacteroidales bacterium]